MGVTLKSKKLAAISLAASFLITGAVTSSPVAAADCVDGLRGRERVLIHNFHIEAEPERKVYLVGETAVVNGTITRPAREDPAGGGVEYDPPESEPAGDVNVGIGLESGDSFRFGFGVTDADGKVDLKIKLDEDTEPGTVNIRIYAWKRQVDTPCLIVDEYGYRAYDNMFRIVGA